MPKFPEETKNVYVPPPGRWVWDDEAHTVEFVSSSPAEDRGLRKRSHTNVNFNDLKLRSEWLVGTFKLNNRGRQSIRKSLNPHLNAYRASVMKRQGDCITIDDVKQVAVSLLQDNYSFPIPFCFLAVLKSKELDEVLTALLLYLSCFFEHKSLENKSRPLMVVDSITEDRMMAEALAKKAIAQKKLAVCYFSLMMDLEMERQQHTSYHKGLMSNSTEWLLHACLYSFFCFVAWVTFGRKDLRDIQEEVGRLLYSDTFNTAVRNRTDGDSGMTFLAVNGSVKTGQADPKETGCNGTLRHRASQRRSALRSITDQRSPLMASLLPLPKERSPHLFNSGWAKKKSPLQAERCDTKALTEQLNQRLARVSFGILGKPSRQFSPRTLIPHREQTDKNEDDNYEPGSNIENNSEDQPDIHVRVSSSSCMGPKSTGFGSTAYINTRISAATMQAVTSDAE